MRQTASGTSGTFRVLAAVAVAALVVAGCGDDDDDTPGLSEPADIGAAVEEAPATDADSEPDAAAPDDEPEAADAVTPDDEPEAADAGSGPVRGGELRVFRGIFHEGWDPDAALELGSIQYIQHVMEPLIRANPDGLTLDPGIAESWDYDHEGLTFTVNINPNAKFSDGTPVTAEDVAFSAEEWKAGPNYGILYASLAEAEIVDDHTVIFSMEYPDSSLDAILTWQSAAVMPKDFGGRSRDEYMANPIGAGPFAVESWQPGAELVLVRNEHFYDSERPYLDRIVITENSDRNQRMVAFESGASDLVLVPPDQISSIPSHQLTLAPAHLMHYLGFNTTAAPFDEADVRRALALAIDYDAIVSLGSGTWETATGGIPPNIADWAPPSAPYLRRDLDQARQLLEAAGATGLSVELIFDTGIVNHDLVAQVIQSSLGDAGVDVEIVALDTNSHIERIGSGEYDLDLWTMVAISPTAIDPVGYYSAVDYLYTGYPLDVIFDVLVEFTETVDDAEQAAAITKVQDEIATEVPFVALANQQTAFAASQRVNGFAPAPWATWWYDRIWLSG
ncbi:MAG: hypothetical protein F4X38_02445 [Acidimicrobiaceae bacterium]|nr:hypothetical protein [Acidimicrobiaceae bacterium]